MPTVKLDQSGRVLIPKAVREALRLGAEQSLQLFIEDGALVLRPERPTKMKIVDGLPLFDVGPVEDVPVEDALEAVRRERDEALSQ